MRDDNGRAATEYPGRIAAPPYLVEMEYSLPMADVVLDPLLVFDRWAAGKRGGMTPPF